MKANLFQTNAGLPNTCSGCGQNPGSHWFAANIDDAIAGIAFCGACANVVTAPSAGSDQAVTNDLTAIRGVGPKREAELHALGIQTFEQLAEADSEILAVQLGAKLEEVAKWQGEASKLAGGE